MGRTPKHNEESIQAQSYEYFNLCRETGTMPTKIGLIMALNISRDTYSEYRKKYPDTIKDTDGYIENAWLQKLTGAGATGPIFYLKNAFKEDYKDRSETDITTKGEAMTAPSNIEEIAARVALELKAQKT